MTCPKCGADNPGNNRFCMKCGAELPTPVSVEPGTPTGPTQGAEVGSMPGAQPTAYPGTTGPEQSTYGSPMGQGQPQTAYGSAYTPPPASAPSWQAAGPAGSTGIAFTQDQLVGFGSRFVAMLIDIILLTIVRYILDFIHLGWLVGIVNIGYFVYFWSTTGQTIGNMAMGIRVARTDGQPLTWSTGIIRYVGYVISCIAILIGVLWVIWDPMKQGWHDKIANTVVVRAR